jgi:hypothetical protein
MSNSIERTVEIINVGRAQEIADRHGRRVLAWLLGRFVTALRKEQR